MLAWNGVSASISISRPLSSGRPPLAAIAHVVSTQPSSTHVPRKNAMQQAGNPSRRPIVPSSPASIASLAARATSASAPTATRYSNGSPTRGATRGARVARRRARHRDRHRAQAPGRPTPRSGEPAARTIPMSARTGDPGYRPSATRSRAEARPIRVIRGSQTSRARSLTQLIRVKSGSTYARRSRWNASRGGSRTSRRPGRHDGDAPSAVSILSTSWWR